MALGRCPACKLQIHPVALVLLFLGFVSWVVALGGLAATTNFCYSNSFGPTNVTISDKTGNDTMVVNTPAGCVEAYSFPWWSIFFEFFLLIGILSTCFIDAFERGRYIFLAYLSMASFFLTVAARDFINKSVTNTNTISFQNYNNDALYASAAGCIMLGVVNYGLIIFIGLGATYDIPDMHMPGSLTKFGIGGPRVQKYEPSSSQGF